MFNHLSCIPIPSLRTGPDAQPSQLHSHLTCSICRNFFPVFTHLELLSRHLWACCVWPIPPLSHLEYSQFHPHQSNLDHYDPVVSSPSRTSQASVQLCCEFLVSLMCHHSAAAVSWLQGRACCRCSCRPSCCWQGCCCYHYCGRVNPS